MSPAPRLSILGIGSALGSHTATLDAARALPDSAPALRLAESLGISTRRTVTDPAAPAFDDDLVARRSTATESPTALALKAVERAIERAKIPTEAIGLIIGDCATPWQTTPSEAQRVGAKLGLKVPAYDVTTLSGSLCSHVSILSSWKPERVPEFVLSVSTNTPSLVVDNRSGAERALVGDGASAVVVSRARPGSLRVMGSVFRPMAQRMQILSIDARGYLHLATEHLADVQEQETLLIEEALAACPEIDRGALVVVPTWLPAARAQGGTAACAVALETAGLLLGSATGVALDAALESHPTARYFVTVQSGLGGNEGWTAFERAAHST